MGFVWFQNRARHYRIANALMDMEGIYAMLHALMDSMGIGVINIVVAQSFRVLIVAYAKRLLETQMKHHVNVKLAMAVYFAKMNVLMDTLESDVMSAYPAAVNNHVFIMEHV